MAEVWIQHVIAETSKAKARKKGHSRTVYLYDKATEENWDDYAQSLQKQLDKKNVRDLLQIKVGKEEDCINRLNLVWDAIEKSILTAANKYIPKKKVYNTAANRRSGAKK